MRIRYNRIVLSIIAAAILGAVAFQGLHAQTKPPVYVVNEIDVTDSPVSRNMPMRKRS